VLLDLFDHGGTPMTEATGSAFKGEILVVDDNPTNLTLLSNMLAGDGYEVRAALSGALALHAAAASPPDLILLDVNMPGLNGHDVCRQLKAAERTRDIPIIFVSALDAIGDKVMAFEVGGADYITKPFQMREVLARVQTQLTLVQLHRELAEKRRELDERYRQIQEMHAALRGYLSERAWEATAAGAAVRERFSVVATEIHGFVRIAEESAPDRLLADLDVYLTSLTKIVSDHGGAVDKILGDATLTFFRSPSRALRAACHVQKGLAELNEKRAAAGSPVFATRIGIATGAALLARHGGTARKEITLIGECVGLATRLQVDARPGGVLLDHATFEAAGRPEDARHMVMRVRGKAELIKAHEILPNVALRMHDVFAAAPSA
jgi:adenylate cyclase